jgi:pSer/pThr/pTyr-binding forkhead associated (FHA) protein
MADPRLNSLHLEGPRRQDYRRAREALLGARGWQTLAAENSEGTDASKPEGLTLLQEQEQGKAREGQPGTGYRFWLVDRDSIYPLKVGINTLGRSPDNDVVLQDPYISRRHCAILIHASDGCEVYDTASKNGTYVNGRRLSGSTRLLAGDEIRMCELQLIFMTKADAGANPIDSPTLME